MRTTIYYFSGTGNSLFVAKSLAKLISNCDIKSIPMEMHSSKLIKNSQKIGFVFPLYAFGLPNIVIKFIKKFDFSNASYIFSIVTRGAKSWGALDQLNELLKSKSNKLSAGFYIDMPGNYIIKHRVCSENEQRYLFKNAEIKIKEIADVINSKDTKIEKTNIFFRIFSRFYHLIWLNLLKSKHSKFYSDENCDHCGLCVDICAFNNIKLDKKAPMWGDNCQMCLACLHFCPKQAIQYGSKTKGKTRYHNPNITSKEMINQNF